MKLSVLCGCLVLGAIGCSVTPSRPQREIFQNEVAPVLRRYCVRCHGIEEREAGLDLRTLRGLVRGGHSGPVINFGQPEKSLLFKMITDEKMPPEGPHPTQDELAILKRWIEQGSRKASRSTTSE